MDINGSVEQTDVSQTQDSSPESTSLQTSSQSNNQQVAQAIAELDKMAKFKFEGQEWTPKDLKQAILRQKDYTQKTQTLSKDRESFEGERKFYENLWADLRNVEKNPKLAGEFLKVYPEKFHVYLKEILGSTQTQDQSQSQQTQQPQVDVELLTRLNKIESAYIAQEVEKNTIAINQQIDALTKKYPDADPEMAVAKVYELYNQMRDQNPNQEVKLTPEQWEKAFKDSHEKINALLKTKYGELVKKQSTANKKAQDVDAGGGTVGRAPQKFKGLSEVTKYAAEDLKTRA